ncbi:TRAP-type C4-dicarboxylate transport system, small permease component [Bacillus sp. OxB-1]|uniref:TRAP transporter small permease n=1 Tax=Bacillus sp. (strain OxB-1) TaxID=98228 RepID=UPI000581DAC1|nr:TRAP transporter small permease [Bacillus sp. OxB-1]BAQ09341.1 TRAP-type C4-dicarboxylate transport system, small permease component [Bacillus sp. OxB-1]
MLKRFEKILTYIEENVAYLTLLFMLLIVFLNFLLRYLFGSSITWGEELARYLMIWSTFIAASLGVKKGAHITLDILVVYLPEKANRVLRGISYILSMVYCILLLYIGIPFINSLITKGQLSPAMQVPMSGVYGAIVVGTALMLIRYIILFISDVIRNEKIEKSEIFAD